MIYFAEKVALPHGAMKFTETLENTVNYALRNAGGKRKEGMMIAR
jgi:hypothetical protein